MNKPARKHFKKMVRHVLGGKPGTQIAGMELVYDEDTVTVLVIRGEWVDFLDVRFAKLMPDFIPEGWEGSD